MYAYFVYTVQIHHFLSGIYIIAEPGSRYFTALVLTSGDQVSGRSGDLRLPRLYMTWLPLPININHVFPVEPVVTALAYELCKRIISRLT